MNLQFPKIEMRTFYLMGIILMSFSVLGSIWNAVAIWNTLTNFGARLTTITGVLFTGLWLGMFYFVWKITPKQPMQVIESKEMDDLLKDLNSTGGNKNGNNSR